MKTILFFCVLLASTQAHAAKPPRIASLKVLESFTVPAVEISGMAWRTNPKTKARELILVSDREHQLFVVNWEKRNTKFAVESIDIAALEGTTRPKQSEYESVFCDESGRVFIIRENPPQILVVSEDLKKIEAQIDLKIEWDAAANSGAEGLIPLKNGHVLVVKEKEPLQILEFAPKGETAQGYQVALSIEKNGLFPFNAKKALEPAFTWQFEKEIEDLFEDSSGLNLGLQGDLYLLGDQRNLIGRIGKKLSAKKEKIKLSKLWSIPSEIKRAEGMVIDEKNRPIIAIDNKKTNQPNLFLLSPLN